MSHANDASGLLTWASESATPRTLSAPSSSADALAAAYLAGAWKWTGCDWSTRLGGLALDVQGLSAQQAQLLFNATAGQEKQAWAQAWHWLRQLEHDAQRAEELAALAYQKAVEGQWMQGRHHVMEALDLEARYRTPVIWLPLRQAIDAAGTSAKPDSVG